MVVGDKSPHCRNEFNLATLCRNIIVVSNVCVGEPLEDEPETLYTLGSGKIITKHCDCIWQGLAEDARTWHLFFGQLSLERALGTP